MHSWGCTCREYGQWWDAEDRQYSHHSARREAACCTVRHCASRSRPEAVFGRLGREQPGMLQCLVRDLRRAGLLQAPGWPASMLHARDPALGSCLPRARGGGVYSTPRDAREGATCRTTGRHSCRIPSDAPFQPGLHVRGANDPRKGLWCHAY